MKELVSFSLRRRFFNGTTILLNILLCIVACGVLFADKVLEIVNPSMFDDQRIYLNLDDVVEETLMNLDTKGVEFIVDDREYKIIIEEDPKAYVLYYDDGYKVASYYSIDENLVDVLRSMMERVHETLTLSTTLTLEEFEMLNQELELKNVVIQENVSMGSDKQNLVFMFISSLYFTMLSFSTSVANEVIYEKSTRQLELILTSVSAKSHFLSKMTVGWLGILIQAGLVAVYVLIAGVLRHLYDGGKGFIKVINHLELFTIKQETFVEFFKSINFEFDFFIKIGCVFLFLIIGILTLQMIMVVLSSFIVNIEEAGNVQGPLYMVLIAVYYFAISVNTPYHMSEGIGYILSFFPFLNMLFMPCRLLIQNVSILELSLSGLLSITFMYLVITKGAKIYQRGVLDYTSRDFIGVLKKTFESEKIYEN